VKTPLSCVEAVRDLVRLPPGVKKNIGLRAGGKDLYNRSSRLETKLARLDEAPVSMACLVKVHMSF